MVDLDSMDNRGLLVVESDTCKVDNLLLGCTVDIFLIECVGQDLTYNTWLDLNSYRLLKGDG